MVLIMVTLSPLSPMLVAVADVVVANLPTMLKVRVLSINIHQAAFDTINGGAPAPLVASLLPTGVAADGATGKAATTLATTVQGLRAGNGNINASKLNAAVPAYNDYVKALVGELGPEKAVASGPAGQKALQSLLTQLVGVANQAAPAVAPSAPAAPSTPSAPGAPSAPTVPGAPSAPPAPEPTAPPTPK
jgi:hypothetical protein